jgi:predicted O-methyltransferase YrrM
MEDMAAFLKTSSKVPGWTRGGEARALMEAGLELPEGAQVVEIGSFLGCGSILLAGARKLAGSGKLHCIDTFDASGDPPSVPHYHAIWLAFGARPLREVFEENIADAGLADWVEIHAGDAAEIGETWSTPIDLLFLDGDQSPAGARAAYDAFELWLKPGGVIALHNSVEREYEAEHDGHYLLARAELHPPRFGEIRIIGSTTFARKLSR